MSYAPVVSTVDAPPPIFGDWINYVTESEHLAWLGGETHLMLSWNGPQDRPEELNEWDYSGVQWFFILRTYDDGTVRTGPMRSLGYEYNEGGWLIDESHFLLATQEKGYFGLFEGASDPVFCIYEIDDETLTFEQVGDSLPYFGSLDDSMGLAEGENPFADYPEDRWDSYEGHHYLDGYGVHYDRAGGHVYYHASVITYDNLDAYPSPGFAATRETHFYMKRWDVAVSGFDNETTMNAPYKYLAEYASGYVGEYHLIGGDAGYFPTANTFVAAGIVLESRGNKIRMFDIDNVNYTAWKLGEVDLSTPLGIEPQVWPEYADYQWPYSPPAYDQLAVEQRAGAWDEFGTVEAVEYKLHRLSYDGTAPSELELVSTFVQVSAPAGLEVEIDGATYTFRQYQPLVGGDTLSVWEVADADRTVPAYTAGLEPTSTEPPVLADFYPVVGEPSTDLDYYYGFPTVDGWAVITSPTTVERWIPAVAMGAVAGDFIGARRRFR